MDVKTSIWHKGALLITLCMVSCGTASTIPMDDAYYWPSKSSETAETVKSAETAQTPQKPAVEYTNVQDTTVTIRIKK